LISNLLITNKSLKQNDFIKDSLTVLERYYPHGIKIMSFFFAYEAQTGTKFKKPMLRIIQQLRGVETYSQVDKIKKRTKDGKEIKQNVLYLRLTQQGYGELKAIKMKNPIKSIFITQIQNYLSDDFPNHEIFYSNDNDRIETHLQSLISKEESPMYDTIFFFFCFNLFYLLFSFSLVTSFQLVKNQKYILE